MSARLVSIAWLACSAGVVPQVQVQEPLLTMRFSQLRGLVPQGRRGARRLRHGHLQRQGGRGEEGGGGQGACRGEVDGRDGLASGRGYH